MEKTRCCISSKDVERILGKSPSTAKRLLLRIRKTFRKEPHHFITVEEFASYTGIPLETIRRYVCDG